MGPTPSWARHKTARQNDSLGHTHPPRGAWMLRGAHTLPGTCAERYRNNAYEGTAGRRSACRGLAYDPPEAGAVAWHTAACKPDRCPQRSSYCEQSQKGHIPPDLVVKCQAIDNAEVIFSWIWLRNIVQTSYRNRKGRCEPLSLSEAQRSTTKSGGIGIFSYDSRYHGLQDMPTWLWTNP